MHFFLSQGRPHTISSLLFCTLPPSLSLSRTLSVPFSLTHAYALILSLYVCFFSLFLTHTLTLSLTYTCTLKHSQLSISLSLMHTLPHTHTLFLTLTHTLTLTFTFSPRRRNIFLPLITIFPFILPNMINQNCWLCILPSNCSQRT